SCRGTRWSGSPTSSASTRHCRSCCRTRRRRMRGCASRTRRRCSGGAPRSSACFPATWRISTWCGSTWTRSSAAGRSELVEALLFDGPFEVPVRRVRWARAIRVVPSRYPPVDLYARIAPAEDFAALEEVEALTNDRLRAEAGVLALVPPEERVYGPGSAYIMAPFAHPNPAGSR